MKKSLRNRIIIDLLTGMLTGVISGIISGLIVYNWTLIPLVNSYLYTNFEHDVISNKTSVTMSLFLENIGAKTEQNLIVKLNYSQLNLTNVSFEPDIPSCHTQQNNFISYNCPLAPSNHIAIKVFLWRYPKKVEVICNAGSPTCVVQGDSKIIIKINGTSINKYQEISA